MFNNNLKKEALKSHEEVVKRYNNSHEVMSKSCEQLYSIRLKAISTLSWFQDVINSIAKSPKEFSITLGNIKAELIKFRETEEFAKDAYEDAKKSGRDLATGIAAGIGVASAGPNILMGIATTFGRASTGTAISALSGAAAKNATIAWIGRIFGWFLPKAGAGMAAGKVILALSGPIGWTISGGSIFWSLFRFSKKNKKYAEDALDEAKALDNAKKALDLTAKKINALKEKTEILCQDFNNAQDKIFDFKDTEYQLLSEEDKLYLISLVNNALSLSQLLNEEVE